MGPRPTKGFVGLKNAGATCYMNSVIQQLYMIPPIRDGILAIEGTGTDVDDDMSGDEKQESEVTRNWFGHRIDVLIVCWLIRVSSASFKKLQLILSGVHRLIII